MEEEECRLGWLFVQKDFKSRLSSSKQLKLALQVTGRNPSDKAIEKYWSQCGGSMNFHRFCQVVQMEGKTKMTDLMKAFRKIDTNGDGFITAQEMQRKLTKRGEKMSVEEVQAVIAEVDKNGDGRLDYAEFCHLLLNTADDCIAAAKQKAVLKDSGGVIGDSMRKPQSSRERRENLERRERRREEIRKQLYSSEDLASLSRSSLRERLSHHGGSSSEGTKNVLPHVSSFATSQFQTSGMEDPLDDAKISVDQPLPLPTNIPYHTVPRKTNVDESREDNEDIGHSDGSTSKVARLHQVIPLPARLPPLKKAPLRPIHGPSKDINGAENESESKTVGSIAKEVPVEEEGKSESGALVGATTRVSADEDSLKAGGGNGSKEDVAVKNGSNSGAGMETGNGQAADDIQKGGGAGMDHGGVAGSVEKGLKADAERKGRASLEGIGGASGEAGVEGEGGAGMKGKDESSFKIKEGGPGVPAKAGEEEAVGDVGGTGSVDGGAGSMPEVKGAGSAGEEPRGKSVAPAAAMPSCVSTPPPKKPKKIENWHCVPGKGCFYLDHDSSSSDDQEELVTIRCHHYQLHLSDPTNVWIEVGVASPRMPDMDVLLFVCRVNEKEEVTDVITYTQHKVEQRWVSRMDLEAGVYALLPYTSGCHLKPQEEDAASATAEPKPLLTHGEDGSVTLTEDAKAAFQAIFQQIDLDSNGCISRTEFDFFNEVTSGEICDDEAWGIIQANFAMTEEDEITEAGFLGLHEMAGRDEEGGEGELWQCLQAMGYNKQLQLRQACPFVLEVWSEDCEGQLEIVDMQPLAPLLHYALCLWVVEGGVGLPVQGVDEGDEEGPFVYLFTASNLTTIVVENKSEKTCHVQLDVSQSVNTLCNRESTVQVVEVPAQERKIGYHLQPADVLDPHSVLCLASKILS